MKQHYESGFVPSRTATSQRTMMGRILLMTLLLFTFIGGARADEVTIGSLDGAENDSYLPMNSLYDYSYTQQIYTADEIGMAGTINSITVWMYGNADLYEMPFDIYMVETDKEAFTSNSDWVTVTAGDIVYSGSVTVHNTGTEAYTFELNTPFEYSGNGNLVICFDNNTGNWKSGLNGMVFTAGDAVVRSIYARRDGTDYDPTNMAGISGYGTTDKRNVIQLEITPGGSSTCETPKNLAATDVTAHSATLTWESEVWDYIVEYKLASLPDVDENWTAASEVDIDQNTFTLVGLLQNTTYNARVQAVCDAEANDYSAWKKVTFTTPVSCPAPTGLAVTLTPGNGKVATLAWTENGQAKAWQICLNDDETNLIAAATNPFQLTDLTPETTYTAKVRAVGDDEYSSWTDNITFTPTDAYILIVNDGTATNEYVPFYGYYADGGTKGQFIIPAESLAAIQWGTISKLTFYTDNRTSNTTFTNNSGETAEFEVYMGEVSNTTFDGTTFIDWATLDKVMNAATLEVADHMLVVTFDTPYLYTGGNLLIGFNETTNGGYAHTYWYGVEAEGASIGGYGSSSSNFGQKNFLPKTTIDYIPGEAPAVVKPKYLAVNYESGVTAEVSWTQDDDAKEWIVAYKAEDDEEFTEVTVTNTPQYTLSGLELGTTYEVKVRAKVGSDVSEWTAPVTFTTDACMPEDMIIVNYTLADSYGDGWNSNYILVVDEDCNVIDALTISSGNSATGTVKLCGSVAQFMWYKGSYPGETSWSFTDADGNVLFEGAGNTDMQTYDLLYSIDLNPYSMPSDIEVSEVGPHTATVAWTETGTATAWQIDIYNNENTLINTIDANSNPFTLTDLNPETYYYVSVRAVGPNGSSVSPCLGAEFTTLIACPVPTDLAASDITAKSALISWNGFAESYDLRYMALPNSKGLAATSNVQPKKASRTNFKGLLACAPKSFANTNIWHFNAKAKAKNSKDSWYYYDNGTYSSSIGTGDSDVYWAMMLPAGTFSESQLTKISVYETSEGNNEENITLYVYAGGDDAPGTLLYEQEFVTEQGDAWHEVMLDEPVEINPFQNLWIVLKEYGAYPASGCSVSPGDANGRWISLDGTDWMDIADAGYDYTWMIRAYLEGTYELPGEWIEVTGINASEYELTNLDPETNYVVQVRGNFGEEGSSNWASTNFTTPELYPRPTNLVATEVGPYSAKLSWTENGDATEWVINVFDNDAEEGNDIDALTNPFTITGLTPETVYEVKVRPAGVNESWSAPIYVIPVLTAPTNLAANPLATSAEISWESNQYATSFNLRYKKTSAPVDATVILTAGDIWGDGSGYQMLLDADANAYGTVFSATGGWTASDYSDFEYLIPEDAECDMNTSNIVYNNSVSIQIPAGTYDWCILNPSPGDKIYIAASNGNVGGRQDDYVFESGKTYEFVPSMYGTNDGIDVTITDSKVSMDGTREDSEWTVIEHVTNPYTITGLSPESYYIVEVQAEYADGESDWTGINFKTLVDNPVPFNIEADLAADGATITWNGEGDSYNVRYRTTANTEVFFYEDFENGLPNTWTTIDADEDGRDWYWTNSSGTNAHSGSAVMTSASSISNGSSWIAVQPDNWLITPRLDLQGTMSVWVRSQNTSEQYLDDHFAIYLSTSGTEVGDFNVTLVDEVSTLTTSYVEYTADLSAYAGQKGYIAIRHFNSNDQFRINIDDFGIYGASNPEGRWQEIVANDATATLSGLATNNAYEYQIQSVKGGATSEWSESGEFALLTLADAATNNSSLLINNAGRHAHVTLADRTLFKDDTWNTLTLPFDIDDLDQTELAGATVKTLVGATVTGTHIDMTFGESPIYGGKPYIIKWAEGSDIVNPEFANVIITAPTVIPLSFANDNVKFIGNYDAFGITKADEDIYYMAADNKLKHTDIDRTIKACRAYFQLTGEASLARDFTLNFGDDEATGIISLEGEQPNNANGWYTVDGKKLDKQPTRKGVYIQDGRKVVIK